MDSFPLDHHEIPSPLLLKDSFAGYSILGCQLFSFCTLNVWAYCPQASKVSEEKFADNLIEERLYLMIHFPLAAFKTHPLSVVFESLLIMCLGVGLF